MALIGFMGAGKSYGKSLAVALKWRFVDLDRVIEEEPGRSIRDIFEVAGEAAFREAETIALHCFRDAEQTVLVVGGGASVQRVKRAFFGDWMTFYLDAPFVQLRERTS